jgi:hypothetical protein
MNIVLKQLKKLAFDSRLKGQYTQYALDYVKKNFGQHYEEEMRKAYDTFLEECDDLDYHYEQEGKMVDSEDLAKEAKETMMRNKFNHALAYNFVVKTLDEEFVKKFNEHFQNKSNIPEDANKFFKREELEQYIDFDQIASVIEKSYNDYTKEML